MDDDDVVDYMLLEAIAAKSAKAEQELTKNAERDRKIKEWKADKTELRALA